MARRKDDLPVFDRGRSETEARDLARALEYAASFEPEVYHGRTAEERAEIPDGFQEWDGDPEVTE